MPQLMPLYWKISFSLIIVFFILMMLFYGNYFFLKSKIFLMGQESKMEKMKWYW